MAKKTDFGPHFSQLGPKLGPKNFFVGLNLYWMLEIVASYHRIQSQGKLMIQTPETSKKTSFWT